MTENEHEVLSYLVSFGAGWAIPLDVGASSNSHHSDTLNRLAKKGLVQFKQRGERNPPEGENGKSGHKGVRGSKCYRITPLGREALAQAKQGG